MRLTLLSIFALSVSACGSSSDICDRGASSAATATAAFKSCGSTTTITFNAATCKSATTVCNDADKKAVDVYLDCVGKIPAPACTTGGADNQTKLGAYGTAAQACQTANTASAACTTAYASAQSVAR